MKRINRGTWMIAVTALVALASGNVMAKGGFIELDPEFDGTSIDLGANPWWPLPDGLVQVHLAEEDDECVVSVLNVMPWTGIYAKQVTIGGETVNARTVQDAEYIDDEGECDGDLSEIAAWGDPLEITLDWYANDVGHNTWYVGEHTIALDVEAGDCDHPSMDPDPILLVTGCLDGSWEVGVDLWAEPAPVADEEILAGIIMLLNPEKGRFYFQEYWEDEATDMGKVLNFKDVDTELFGDLEGCVVIKEWVPLEPGNVEHKYYCEGVGLVLVEGNAGGPTVWTDLVYDSRYD